MAQWKFEVADWLSPDARDRARASLTAQAEAQKVMVADSDLAVFETMADTCNTFLSELGVVTGWDVRLTAYANSQETGAFELNIGFQAYPPVQQ